MKCLKKMQKERKNGWMDSERRTAMVFEQLDTLAHVLECLHLCRLTEDLATDESRITQRNYAYQNEGTVTVNDRTVLVVKGTANSCTKIGLKIRTKMLILVLFELKTLAVLAAFQRFQ